MRSSRFALVLTWISLLVVMIALAAAAGVGALFWLQLPVAMTIALIGLAHALPVWVLGRQWTGDRVHDWRRLAREYRNTAAFGHLGAVIVGAVTWLFIGPRSTKSFSIMIGCVAAGLLCWLVIYLRGGPDDWEYDEVAETTGDEGPDTAA